VLGSGHNVKVWRAMAMVATMVQRSEGVLAGIGWVSLVLEGVGAVSTWKWRGSLKEQWREGCLAPPLERGRLGRG
jgi:hypothetical protein